MFRISQSLEFDHSADHVWPYLIAFEQVPLWERGVLEVRQTTPGAPGLGTEIVARRQYGGRESTVAGRIVRWEAGRSAAMELGGGPLSDVVVEYSVDPIDHRRSLVAYRAEGRLGGALRLLQPLVAALGRREARRNLASLRARIDAGIPPRSTATPHGPG